MNRIVTFALPISLLLAHATSAHHADLASTVDSIGIQRKDGKRFVLHRVNQGQTLYSVARRYGSSVDAIKSANPDLTDNVRYDQLLRVPVSEATVSRREQRDEEKALKKEEKEKLKAAKESEQEDDAETVVAARSESKSKTDKSAEKAARTTASNGIHVVENGQTLYSLAVRYNVSMADLRRWNDVGVDGIQVGQSLVVTEKAYEAKKPSDSPTSPVVVKEKEPVTVSVVKEKPAPVRSAPTKTASSKSGSVKSTESQPVKLEVKPIITPDPLPTPGTRPKSKPAEAKPAEAKATEAKPDEKVTEPKAPAPHVDDEPVAAVRKANVKSEIGFADMIEGNDPSTKYLALHRSAPIGTLVQVRNDITNQSLYVKVIGKLPDTGLNNQVLIRLSGRAFEKLSPNGQRFRAEVSYTN